MTINVMQSSPDVLRERLIASRAAEYIEQQKTSGVPRVNIDSEASSIVAKLIATDAVIAELAAQRVELVTRFRTLLAEHQDKSRVLRKSQNAAGSKKQTSSRPELDDPDLVS
jgi:hypothetical protein